VPNARGSQCSPPWRLNKLNKRVETNGFPSVSTEHINYSA
jgi:hypothetical protein